MLQRAARRLHAPTAPAPAYTALRTDVAVWTLEETLAAQSQLLLGRHTASPESSLLSSIQQWLQTSEPMAPPSTAVRPRSGYSGRQPTLPLGAEAAKSAPRVPRTSRASFSSRRTRQSAVYFVAAEILRYSREMSGNKITMFGQMQAQTLVHAQAQQNQSQNQINQIRYEMLF